MAKVKQRITFEDAITPPDTYELLGQYDGFFWNHFAAIDSTDPAHGDFTAGSGTVAVRQTSPSQLSSFFYSANGAQENFAFRKLSVIDIDDNDTGESIWIRGYRDNVLVAEQFVFLDGSGPVTYALNDGFRKVDLVTFVGNTSSWAMDDLVMRVPAPPAETLLG